MYCYLSLSIRPKPALLGLCLFYIFFSSLLNAAELTSDKTVYELSSELVYFEDTTQQLSLNDVLLKTFQPVDENNKNNLGFGFSESAYWIKFELQNYPLDQKWLLELSSPLLDYVDVYVIDVDSEYAERKKENSDSVKKSDIQVLDAFKTGDAYEFSKRPISHRHFLFPFLLKKNQQVTVLMRVESSSSLRLPLKLWKYQEFFEADQIKIGGHGIYFGILLIMMIYNLFIFFSMKEKAYLHYVFYVGTYILVQASLNGFTYQFLMPELVSLNQKIAVLSVSLVILFGCTFAVNFLNLKQHNLTGYRLLTAIAWAGGINFIFAIFAPYYWSIKGALFFTIAATLSIFSCSMLLWIKYQVREARFFTVAWFGFVVGTILIALNRVQLLPDNYITENAAQIGSSVEVMLLSLALVDKFNQMRREKERVTYQAQDSLTQVNSLLSETLNRLECSNKIKNEFLTTVSHELRTPMNGIIGANQLLETVDLSSEAKEYVQISQHSSQQMMELIDSMLEFVNLQAGMSKVKKSPVNIDLLFDELKSFTKNKIEDKKINFDWENKMSSQIELQTDKDKLLSILKALLDNAIKYTLVGTINLKVKFIQDVKRPSIEFCVQDTGIGIEKKHLHSIFEMFNQVDSTYRRVYSGLGMGLTIAQTLANVLGGNIRAESKINRGSSFYLSIPLYHLDDR